MKRVASILAFALLMAVRDEFDDHYVRMLIAASAGASLALGMINSKAKSEGGPRLSKNGWARGSLLLWVAMVSFSVSFFLPVVGAPMNSGYYFGWEAATLAMSPLWNPQEVAGDLWRSLYFIATGLTNVFMVVAVVTQLRHRERRSMYWMWLAWFAVALDASWMCLEGSLKDLRIGYYLWLLSFGFLATSFLPSGVRKEASGAQPAT